MNAQATQQSSGLKITPGDVIYTLFRHKKKIIFFIALGIIAGGSIYYFWPESYTSRAQILLKYVTENREVISEDGGSRTVTIGGRGSEHVMSTELAILNSVDLATQLNESIPELSQYPNKTAVNLGLVETGFTAISGRGSNIINLSYSHTNRDLPQRALQEAIDTYYDKHFHIHQDRGSFDDFLTQQTDQAKARLLQTEEELIATRRKAGLISVEQARNNLVQEISRIRQSINETKAEIAESQTIYDQLSGRTNTISEKEESNESDAIQISETEATQAIRTFERKRTQLEILKSREKNLLTRFTPESSRYQTLVAQMTKTEDELNALITKYPELFDENSLNSQTATADPEELARQTRLQLTRTNSLQSRQKQLESQLVELQNEASRIDQVELAIKDLSRRKALEESNYRTLLANLEKNRLSDAQSDGRVSNITIIQPPTPPATAQNTKSKAAGGIAAGLASLGIIWAMLTDLFLDRSIKRPTEIQRSLGIPLFISLPDINSKRFKKLSGKASRQLLLQAGRTKQREASKTKEKYEPKSPTLKAAALSKPNEYGINENDSIHTIALWDESHALSEHFEGLRDKVITYFESKNLTHKPKLIGMTGVGQGSGVTTIASGLAGSLSKIGEGNVLLVDMTLGHETAQQFYKGKNLLNLDEVLEASDDAKMENNLYVVAEGSNGVKLPRILPQRFNKIMPKLRASDFDYIIFDLPPVSPISSTPRISSFMDIVLMVMESEKTSRDVANQALELLGESKAHLGGVLNKTKSRVPRKLEQDLLSQA